MCAYIHIYIYTYVTYVYICATVKIVVDHFQAAECPCEDAVVNIVKPQTPPKSDHGKYTNMADANKFDA